jgi:hypothetical protein
MDYTNLFTEIINVLFLSIGLGIFIGMIIGILKMAFDYFWTERI